MVFVRTMLTLRFIGSSAMDSATIFPTAICSCSEYRRHGICKFASCFPVEPALQLRLLLSRVQVLQVDHPNRVTDRRMHQLEGLARSGERYGAAQEWVAPGHHADRGAHPPPGQAARHSPARVVTPGA